MAKAARQCDCDGNPGGDGDGDDHDQSWSVKHMNPENGGVKTPSENQPAMANPQHGP